MTHVRTKILIATILLSSAVSYMTWAGVRKGWVYYLQVDTFVADASYHDQRVRLSGRVAEDNVQAHPARLTATFDLVGTESRLPVCYQGVIPDMFKPGIDVVLEGRMADSGLFQADVMMTKCASKYQAEEHAKRLEATP